MFDHVLKGLRRIHGRIGPWPIDPDHIAPTGNSRIVKGGTRRPATERYKRGNKYQPFELASTSRFRYLRSNYRFHTVWSVCVWLPPISICRASLPANSNGVHDHFSRRCSGWQKPGRPRRISYQTTATWGRSNESGQVLHIRWAIAAPESGRLDR